LLGEEVIRRVGGLREACATVRHHHERWDGAGYPDRLARDEIPIEARIVACADVYSALTSDRAYRAGWTHSDAIAELQRGAGSQFDASIVEAFCAVVDGYRSTSLA